MKMPSRHTLIKGVRFGVTGIFNTLLDVGIFQTLISFAHLSPVISNIVAYTICVLISFTINSIWTFGVGFSEGTGRRFIYFLISSISALFLSTMIVYLLSPVTGALLAKISSVIPVFLWNFTLSHNFVFRLRASQK